MPRRARSTLLVGVLITSVALVGSCSSGPSAAPTLGPSLSPSPSPSLGAAASSPPRTLAGTPLTRCGLPNGSGVVIAQCGHLRVAEDPSKPDGRQIELKVAVIPAVSANPEPDPVFILAGGPGGAAAKDLAWTAARYPGMHATRDIVLVDQRGTGESNELRFEVPPDFSGLSPEETQRQLRAWVEGQLERFDADATMYTTAIAMDDLDAVRSALGYDKINVMGSSYGATAAQYYIRQHPDHIRTVILDGATLIDVPVMELIAPNSQRALELLFGRCAEDAACGAAYPTLPADFAAAQARLAKGAVTTEVSSLITRKPIVISAGTFAAVVHQGLVSSDLTAGLPWLIRAAAEGRWNDVASVVARLEQPEVGLQVMSGMIRCAEAWAVFEPDRVAELGAGSYLRDVELTGAKQQAAGCAYAPRGYVPADDAARATTSLPVLLLVGNADPQDPPSNIATAATDFPNSLTVVVPQEGHTVAHLGCVPNIVDAFIAAGSVEGLHTTCIMGMVPPPFRLP
ncbi:MAG TPA: alpha/beta fold hydrolase [Candidatus Acidoferrales bacterium]|nr:alpha/beta fold hydrolase [Candidatus Acidoferrales bacterium]